MYCVFLVICPTHSVCVPCACGLKVIVLKLVDDPLDTAPIHSPSTTGAIFGGPIYHAFTFSLEPFSGIEMSFFLKELGVIIIYYKDVFFKV